MIEYDLTVQAMRKFKYLVHNPTLGDRATLINRLLATRIAIQRTQRLNQYLQDNVQWPEVLGVVLEELQEHRNNMIQQLKNST